VQESQADIALIAACQQGDHQAFRQVYEEYRDRVYALCRQMSGRATDAEDLTQEAFIWAFRHIGSFRAESSFGTWLYRITANRCLSELRKRRPETEPLQQLEQRNVVPLSPEPAPDEALVGKELGEQVERAVAALPESQRLIFVLGTQLGMRYRDIGAIAGCSEDAVKVRIHRARKRMRDALRPYLDS
jgi:RNA polymerase sigma-70 factor, ECF subfamily